MERYNSSVVLSHTHYFTWVCGRLEKPDQKQSQQQVRAALGQPYHITLCEYEMS